MTLLDPNISEDELAGFDQLSYSFLETIKDFYTRETAMEALESLAVVLGKDWKARLIFGKLNGKLTRTKKFQIRISATNPSKIPAIKSVRALTGFSLTEAKYFVERAYFEAMKADIKDTPDLSSSERDKWISNELDSIKTSGFEVFRI